MGSPILFSSPTGTGTDSVARAQTEQKKGERDLTSANNHPCRLPASPVDAGASLDSSPRLCTLQSALDLQCLCRPGPPPCVPSSSAVMGPIRRLVSKASPPVRVCDKTQESQGYDPFRMELRTFSTWRSHASRAVRSAVGRVSDVSSQALSPLFASAITQPRLMLTAGLSQGRVTKPLHCSCGARHEPDSTLLRCAAH